MRLRGWLRRTRTPDRSPRRGIDLRIAAPLFDRVRNHVEDFSRGEEAGFLLCARSRLPNRDVLLARHWLPVPDAAISRYSEGSVLSWSAEFNSDVLDAALKDDCTPVLVHSHGGSRPAFSADDRDKERALFPAFARLVEPLPTGSLLLGRNDAAGSFRSTGPEELQFRRLIVIGETIETWHSAESPPPPLSPRRRLARQSVAIGPAGDAKLARANVAVIGISGGGSHVVQQLAHQGVGTLIVLDDQLVEESNLGRLVGATHADIDTTAKVDLAHRLATGIDPSIEVVRVRSRFPSPEAIEALKDADVVVSCVDRFDAREGINSFCRRYLIPHLDIGIDIRSTGERLATADGQLIVSLPGQPCMRCWFLTDALLAAERRDRPPGYDQNPDAPGDPQVVSMNGVLASEACNCVLDLITGYSNGRRGGKFWQYEGRSGRLIPEELPPSRPNCPACAEQGYGDPLRTLAGG